MVVRMSFLTGNLKIRSRLHGITAGLEWVLFLFHPELVQGAASVSQVSHASIGVKFIEQVQVYV